MIKIQDIVKEIVLADEEFLSALTNGYANLSAYAKRIQSRVEKGAKKKVGIPGIVVALSRECKHIAYAHPFLQDIQINKLATQSPLSELVYEKNPQLLSQLTAIYSSLTFKTDDFFTITFSTNEITVICSDNIRTIIEKKMRRKPVLLEGNLASISIFLDPKYYYMPNITFSLLRRIAQKRIPLAETITTRTEIIFVFNKKYLGEIVNMFS